MWVHDTDELTLYNRCLLLIQFSAENTFDLWWSYFPVTQLLYISIWIKTLFSTSQCFVCYCHLVCDYFWLSPSDTHHGVVLKQFFYDCPESLEIVLHLAWYITDTRHWLLNWKKMFKYKTNWCIPKLKGTLLRLLEHGWSFHFSIDQTWCQLYSSKLQGIYAIVLCPVSAPFGISYIGRVFQINEGMMPYPL